MNDTIKDLFMGKIRPFENCPIEYTEILPAKHILSPFNFSAIIYRARACVHTLFLHSCLFSFTFFISSFL